jgi:peptidoglycan/LPS O-acetylase OafA/YrhL
VDLFFILSGAVMYHVHGGDFDSYQFASHVRFLKLRLARIYPLHVFCLLTFAFVVWTLPGFTVPYRDGSFSLKSFLATLALINNWGFSQPTMWNGPTWSLSAEWLGYLAFPAIVIASRRLIPKGYEAAVATMLLALLVIAFWCAGAPNIGMVGKAGILRMACEFSAGCLLYKAARTRLSNIKSYLRAGILITVFCAYDLPLHWGAIFGLALLVFALCAGADSGSAIFSNRLAVWLGEISFSLYLIHWPIIQIYQWTVAHSLFDSRILSTILVASILLSAQFVYTFVEMPARRYFRSRMNAGIARPSELLASKGV